MFRPSPPALGFTLASVTLSCLGWIGPALAQPIPSTDVYLLPITQGETGPTLGEPRNITDRDGYDNQPMFARDGKSLFYTSMSGDQTDIVRYQLEKKTTTPVTNTPESEYSPTPVPGENAISVVRVEADGRQRLWRFPLGGGGSPDLILPDLEPVGYHAWSAEKELVLFVLGEPPTLVRARPGAPGREVAKNIGRALHLIPGQKAFSFIQKNDPEAEAAWTVSRLDLANNEISVLAKTFPGREDLAWSPTGVLWMADNSRLAYWCEPCGGWQEVADLEDQGLHGITRLAIHPDGNLLALVAERPATATSEP